MNKTINLNADLGESFGAWTMGEDEALLQVVRSAVFWPGVGETGADWISSSDHRLVWVELQRAESDASAHRPD